MHEHIKEFLKKTGTSHHEDHALSEHDGMSHREMHEIEGEHFHEKKHHRHEEL